MALLKKWWIYPIILVSAILVVFTVFSSGGGTETTVEQFTEYARAGQVTTIRVARNDRDIEYELRGSDQTYETTKERLVSLREVLSDAGVGEDELSRIDIYYGGSSGSPWLGLFINFLPIIIIFGILFTFLRKGAFRAKGVELPYDPVCKTGVDSRQSAGTSTFQLVTYNFCSRQHKAEFDGDPARYLLLNNQDAPA